MPHRIGILALCLLLIPTMQAMEVERFGGVNRLWIESAGSYHLLRETEEDLTALDSGADPSGKAHFATWDEAGERWHSYSRDGGASWSRSRPLRRELRLVDGATLPGSPMPRAEAGFEADHSSRLHIVQFKTTSIPVWRQTLTGLGAEVLNHVPHNGHIVRADTDILEGIAALDFVERVEPYHPWYRIEPGLRGSTHEERVRVATFEWGSTAKERVISAAEALGAQVAEYWPSGNVVELWLQPDQLRALAAHDDVLWMDRWREPEPDMDLVRQDSGAAWLEDTYGYCGQGVRGEVMDLGIQDDHPDFDGIMLHGAHSLDSHGTATYGIVFGNGDRDGDGDGKATGTLICDGAQGIFADRDEFTDRFVHTQELKNAPYYASFQTNSWGGDQTTAYTTDSSDMDDMIWRLDIAILQSQSNTGDQRSRPEAWAKNIISVGGIRHYDTIDTSDDAWANGASIGPAADDRIKPDVSYWYDYIHTTSTGSGYTSFGGTSAATPETAGVVGLIVQMWADNVWETDPQGATVFDRQPHASTIKALLINNAQQYDFTGSTGDLTRTHQGWGRPSAGKAYERATRSLVVDEEESLLLDELVTYDIAVASGEEELKVTMVYPDPPGTVPSMVHRINDVNLEVTSPSATVYHGNVGLDVGMESTPGGSPNAIDTVENVFIRNPEAGIWTVKVEAVEINQDGYLATTEEDDVTYALVVTGGTGLYTSGEGQVRFLKSLGACDATFPLRVRDGDAGSSTVMVDLWSDSETTPETIVLQETAAGSGNYTGEIVTTSGPVVPGDGILTAVHGDTLTVEYMDGAIPVQDNASIDCQPPVISQVAHTGITDVGATITWTTDEESDSRVSWDTAAPPLNTDARSGRTTSHTVRITGLSECTTYYYSVGSEDPVGNFSEDDNGGAYFYLVTLMNTAGELHPCREGKLIIDTDTVSCSGSVPVRLTDLDLNTDPGSVETVEVSMTSTTETIPEILVLTENGPDSSEFVGSIPTGGAPAVGGDGILQTADGDLITGRYTDTNGVSFDTITADCAGPEITGVAVSNITEDGANISWTTSEPTTGYLDWGNTPALGNEVHRTYLTTSHNVDIGPFAECERIYFRIVASDALDNTGIADREGSPYELNAAMVPGVFLRDDFEYDSGWTLEGEWEIDTPQGMGSSPGDPTSAFSGTDVLGHDLSGLGAHPGDFEPTTTEIATSPVIDASALSNAELTFRRWLNVSNGAIAFLEVYDGGSWRNIWQSPTVGGHTESAWSDQSYNVSSYADGNANFQVRFRQNSYIPQGFAAGWNVDMLLLRDGSLPFFDICGGCGGAPTFGGLVSASDDDPCADSGVTLAWQAAPAWGTGSGGSYAVYRDTTPGFTPGPGNLLASGVTGTTWADPSPPSDVTLYYLVRAENDETCGSGPNNSGLVDANLVYATTMNATSQLPPGGLGATLRLANVNHAHARLLWSELPEAFAYRIYRSDAADAVFGLETETGEINYEDEDVFGDGQSWYYLVRSVDACGNEGP
jgi:hypothetical protein